MASNKKRRRKPPAKRSGGPTRAGGAQKAGDAQTGRVQRAGGGTRAGGAQTAGEGGRPAGGAQKPPVAKDGGGAEAGAGGRRSAKELRMEAAERARRKQAVRRNAIIAVVAVLATALVVKIVTDRAADRRERQAVNTILTAGECRIDTRSDSGSEHIPNPGYGVNPPSGGNHTPQAAGAGVYAPGQVPPDGPLVHAMEHGFVILWYRTDLDPDTVEQIEAVSEQFPDSTLVVPRDSLEVPVAATAWRQRLLCDQFEEEPLAEFARFYRDKGPEKGFI